MKPWLFILLIPFLMPAQAPDIAWQRLIGGNYDDSLNDVLQLPDGGYLLTGGSNSDVSGDKALVPFGGGPGSGGDIWLVRLDQDRNVIW